jgi:hypothetical protein
MTAALSAATLPAALALTRITWGDLKLSDGISSLYIPVAAAAYATLGALIIGGGDRRRRHRTLPASTEAAVYFCALEALQNITKYAAASRATVRLTCSGGSLQFTITDHGTGFEETPATKDHPCPALRMTIQAAPQQERMEAGRPRRSAAVRA